MSEMMYYNAWLQAYQPKADENGDALRHDWEEVKDLDYHTVWTELDDLAGTIIAGRHIVNRLAYFVTEKPWEDSWLEVTDLITPRDYLELIEMYGKDEDSAVVQQLREEMKERFGGA